MIQSSFCLSSRILSVCLVEVPCLRASGENHPFDLGYCDSAPTIGFLSVCLGRSAVLASERRRPSPDSFDSPEQPSQSFRPQSLLRFCELVFFGACKRAESLPIRQCLDLLIEPVGQPLGASTLLLRRAGTLTAIHERLRQAADPLVDTEPI